MQSLGLTSKNARRSKNKRSYKQEGINRSYERVTDGLIYMSVIVAASDKASKAAAACVGG